MFRQSASKLESVFRCKRPIHYIKPLKTHYRLKSDLNEKLLKENVQEYYLAQQGFNFKNVFKAALTILVPITVSLSVYTAYNISKGEDVFIPLWYQSTVELTPENNTLLDMDKLKRKCKSALVTKLSLSSHVQQSFGLPIQVDEELETFQVFIKFHNVSFQGLQINANSKGKNEPRFQWANREISVTDKVLDMLEPFTTQNSDSIDFLYDTKSQLHADYDIIIKGRLSLKDSKKSASNSIDPDSGDVHFTGLIQFDHTKTLLIDKATLTYKVDGKPVIKKLW
ncbi:Hypothetical protein PP7435_CHR1-0325 [Komagataella phaffii CBS 7435]|uniref:Uncharacterized protein n=2 Tax=Komagataella phaffii TaxID=460519 RepID=C4QVW2_KOMPG|nr:uncharacterized protein PAS_chr1-1_0464 [Komagataella phaffii GS115]AOA60695.1 GQ67_02588T0 [Komagataella phaffii]CAH2446048.1 Hypothetical protein BQ9382_C1-1690 [Komagataella phaffii CBS 7435]AOA65851.1 GQ68_02660T0 [Komagataella phaffii GS115]CAY67385.1 hypothetical protein PAS_chr1-1_0464 [Komagataella phaffii GS115]CCA36485.1 Hypothetical protein PP7435_CHR1-0325 [Komagataella phaffii CBS 7435]